MILNINERNYANLQSNTTDLWLQKFGSDRNWLKVPIFKNNIAMTHP